MKNPLSFCNTNDPVFYEPYYLYDLITVINKSTCLPEMRHRAAAISFSDEGQIILAFALCNPKDNFSKKVAREGSKGKSRVIGLNSKVRYMYDHFISSDRSSSILINDNMSYYFSDIEQFNQFVTAHVSAIRDTFMHNNLYHTRLKSYNQGAVPTKIHFDDSKALEDVLFLKTFVNNAYIKFMSHPTMVQVISLEGS